MGVDKNRFIHCLQSFEIWEMKGTRGGLWEGLAQ